MRSGFSKVFWGIFLLAAAAFVLMNQLYGFTNIGIWSIILAALALAFIVQCIAQLNFASLPIPVALVYIIFRSPLGLPHIQTWTLILAAVLASIGLSILLPHKIWHVYHGKHDKGSCDHPQKLTESGDINNPSVNVNFGATSRHLYADSLESVQLCCSFGALEIYFDHVELNPNGADAIVNCSLGAIKLFIPQHWQINDRLNCSLGGVDIEKGFAPAQNAPQLTLSGSVSLGGIEIRYLK